MNKELSEYILSQIGQLPYIDRWSGVVQVLTLPEGNKKIPAGYVLQGAEFGLSHSPSAMIPDSQYKGVLFFEDKGITPTRNLSSAFGYRSDLRIICWLNNNKIGMDQSVHSLSTYAISDLTQKITKAFSGNGVFMVVRPAVSGIAMQDAGVFAKYDFDDKTSGYLQGNFSFFALDIATTFYTPKKCAANFITNHLACN